jgi:NADPH:quinone reductase-like Zn-dependent oxidoreductase
VQSALGPEPIEGLGEQRLGDVECAYAGRGVPKLVRGRRAAIEGLHAGDDLQDRARRWWPCTRRGITFGELTWDLSWTTRDGTERTPVIPSHEVSGTVVATGPGVTDPAPGDDVYALIDFDRDGAAAEYVTVPASALAARPRSVSHVQAATLPLAALTAWQALVDHAGLVRGERVLVQGGAGGVGVYAVQLAAVLGGQDVVIDTVGGQVLADSFALLRRGGRLITLAAPPDPEVAAQYGVHAMFFVVQPDRGELARLASLADEGRLRPVVSQVFPLADGRRAYASQAQNRPPGKTVLAVR